LGGAQRGGSCDLIWREFDGDYRLRVVGSGGRGGAIGKGAIKIFKTLKKNAEFLKNYRASADFRGLHLGKHD